FRGGSAAVPLYEIGLPACVDRIQKPESAQFIGAHDSQQVDRFIRVMKVQRNVGTDHREPVFLYASVKRKLPVQFVGQLLCSRDITCQREGLRRDRKSTRLNSSHVAISYAVFCLKKKNKNNHHR